MVAESEINVNVLIGIPDMAVAVLLANSALHVLREEEKYHLK